VNHIVRDGRTEAAGADIESAIVLGASNVVRSAPTVIRLIGESLGRPARIRIAAGHGRSYGLETNVLGRRLPSLLDCGLWRELEAGRRERVRLAVLADIGNDIMYGVAPEIVVEWVDAAIARLPPELEVVIVLPPVATVCRLDPRAFLVLRSLLFPQHPRAFDDVLTGLERLSGLLVSRGLSGRLRAVTPDPSWYGPDPIHFRRRAWGVAWSHILGRAPEAPGVGAKSAPFPWWRIRLARPERWWLGPFELGSRQPVLRAPDLDLALF
jgi:hypothetical protein